MAVPRAAAQPFPMLTIQVRAFGSDRLALRVPYDRDINERVRAIPGRRWEPASASGRFRSVPSPSQICAYDSRRSTSTSTSRRPTLAIRRRARSALQAPHAQRRPVSKPDQRRCDVLHSRPSQHEPATASPNASCKGHTPTEVRLRPQRRHRLRQQGKRILLLANGHRRLRAFRKPPRACRMN
jgi:hypothetical protein